MAGKYRRRTADGGETWTVSWVEGGRQCRRSLGRVTEAQAEAERKAIEHRLAIDPVAGPALEAFAVRYATWHAAEYPDSYYRVEQILRCHLLPALGGRPLMAIRPETVEGYKHARLAAGAAPGTVTKELRTLQAVLHRAELWDVIPRNPARGVRPPRDLASRPPRWYTAEELAAIYRASSGLEAAQWRLIANTGLRRAEALALRRADVDREAIRILSTSEARTKSGRWRHVPLTDGAREALERLKAAKGTAGHVLPRQHPRSLSRAFERAADRAGAGGHIHCLRHTYCSHLVAAGVPLRTVQLLAGHASARTTEQYAHLAPGHLRDAVRGLRL